MSPTSIAAALSTVARRIQNYKARGIAIGEANTIDTLITPILRALGWDIEDIDQVKREHRQHPKDNPVDFALLQEGEPVLYVEAKGLFESLDDRKWITQTHAYAHSSGVEWAVLTNGEEWRIYKVSALGQAEDKILVKVRIDDPQAPHTIDVLARPNLVPRCKLETLWRTKEIDGVMKNLFSNMTEHTGILKAFVKASEGKLTLEEVRQALRRAKPRADWGQVGDGWDGSTNTGSVSAATTKPEGAHVGQAMEKGGEPGNTGNTQQGQHTTNTPSAQMDDGLASADITPQETTGATRRSPTLLPRMQDLIEAGLLQAGQTLRIRHLPNETCSIIDGKTCRYKNQVMSYNVWGLTATGWSAIQIYMQAETEDGVLLHDLRAQMSARP